MREKSILPEQLDLNIESGIGIIRWTKKAIEQKRFRHEQQQAYRQIVKSVDRLFDLYPKRIQEKRIHGELVREGFWISYIDFESENDNGTYVARSHTYTPMYMVRKQREVKTRAGRFQEITTFATDRSTGDKIIEEMIPHYDLTPEPLSWVTSHTNPSLPLEVIDALNLATELKSLESLTN